jgi:CheY-like chemotaxis protein
VAPKLSFDWCRHYPSAQVVVDREQDLGPVLLRRRNIWAWNPSPVAMILDLMKPVNNGWEVLSDLAEQPGLAARVRIVVVSARRFREDELAKVTTALGHEHDVRTPTRRALGAPVSPSRASGYSGAVKLFISWSGALSRAVAKDLREWLPSVIQRLEPFMSDKDIEAGKRWFAEISGALAEAKFGVLVVTPQNKDAPWLVFEAGALGKSLDQNVVPYVVGMSFAELGRSPLSGFHGKENNKEGTRELLESINKAMDAPLTEAALRQAFDKWWPDLEERLGKHGFAAAPQVDRKPDMETMVQEILDLVRGMYSAHERADTDRARQASFEAALEVAMSSIAARPAMPDTYSFTSAIKAPSQSNPLLHRAVLKALQGLSNAAPKTEKDEPEKPPPTDKDKKK